MEIRFSDYITVSEAAEAWGITERRVLMYIADNRIPGAVKKGSMWLIPSSAEKPEDRRKYNRRRPKKDGAPHE